MKRIDDVAVVDQSVKFAGEYVNEKFKDSQDPQKHLVLNTMAHGFYMGSKFVERKNNPNFADKMFASIKKVLDLEIGPQEEAIRAANFYIKAKGYQGMSFGEQALVRASLCKGFVAGVEFGEQRA